jgi:hypothetical protein
MKTIWRNINLFVAVIFLAVFAVQSQVDNNKKSSKSVKASFKIVTEKPSVYIDFERIGKRKPPGDDVSDEAVWLRLHNNMRSAITFCAFSILDDKGNLLSYQEAGEIGVDYEVEVTDSSLYDETKSDVPIGNKSVGLCHVFTLKASKSIVFSVPKEHLVKGLSIKVPFNYEWEDRDGNDPSHSVYFNSRKIPL